MATQLRRPVEVYLADEQLQRLAALGRQRGVPVADLIAEGITLVLSGQPTVEVGEPPPTADDDPIRSSIGIFDSGITDLGAEHDRYIAEYVDEENRVWWLKSS